MTREEFQISVIRRNSVEPGIDIVIMCYVTLHKCQFFTRSSVALCCVHAFYSRGEYLGSFKLNVALKLAIIVCTILIATVFVVCKARLVQSRVYKFPPTEGILLSLCCDRKKYWGIRRVFVSYVFISYLYHWERCSDTRSKESQCITIAVSWFSPRWDMTYKGTSPRSDFETKLLFWFRL